MASVAIPLSMKTAQNSGQYGHTKARGLMLVGGGLSSSPCHEQAAPCEALRIVLCHQARRVEAAQHFVGRKESELVHFSSEPHSVGTVYLIVKPEA